MIWIGIGCFIAGIFFAGILGAALSMASLQDDWSEYHDEFYH